jgi:Zn-dependent peptidase ImmA (M78 family)
MQRASSARTPKRRGAQAAGAVRHELELGFAPIGGAQLWEIIRDRGIDLAFQDFGVDGGDGLYVWDGHKALMVLNIAPEVLRIRFTAAHELGHHELHRDDPQLYPDRDVMRDVTSGTGDEEEEAHVFAAEFLVPARALERDVAAYGGSPLEPIDVVRLVQSYGVRYEFLLWRLENLGLIPPAERVRLREQADQVVQLKEIVGFDQATLAPPLQPLPTDFVVNAFRLYHHEVIDEMRLAELLRTTIDDAVRRAHAMLPVERPTPTDESQL